MCCCRCMQQEQVRGQTFDEKARAESDFFTYVSTSYRHFLSGNDEECTAVDEAQTGVFQERADATKARNEELQQVCSEPVLLQFS